MIDATELEQTLIKCLFKEDEVDPQNPGKAPEGAVIVRGIMRTFGFHPGRLEETRPIIKAMLEQLPDGFMVGKGGGMSFLDACYTKANEHWGEHPSMENLFVMGEALGMVSCLMPRDAWQALPGGMPYYQVHLDGRPSTAQAVKS